MNLTIGMPWHTCTDTADAPRSDNAEVRRVAALDSGPWAMAAMADVKHQRDVERIRLYMFT